MHNFDESVKTALLAFRISAIEKRVTELEKLKYAEKRLDDYIEDALSEIFNETPY